MCARDRTSAPKSENGGFPGSILADRNLRLRNRNAPYLQLVDASFDELIPVIAQRQAARGGNVVMVQVRERVRQLRR